MFEFSWVYCLMITWLIVFRHIWFVCLLLVYCGVIWVACLVGVLIAFRLDLFDVFVYFVVYFLV